MDSQLSVFSYIKRVDSLLEHASAALVAGDVADTAHHLGNARQVLINLGVSLKSPGA
jgi:hypothetical protein